MFLEVLMRDDAEPLRFDLTGGESGALDVGGVGGIVNALGGDVGACDVTSHIGSVGVSGAAIA